MAKFSRYIVGADYTRDPKCLDCEFITLCGGGCPLVRLRNKEEGLKLNHCCPEKTHMEKQQNALRNDFTREQKKIIMKSLFAYIRLSNERL